MGFNSGDPEGSDIRLGEMGRPSPLDDLSGLSESRRKEWKGYRGWKLAEFTYPIQPYRPTGAHWFYSLPEWERVCMPAEEIYRDYLDAVRYGNIFSLDVGPMPDGRLRPIDVETLREVGEYVRGERALPPAPASRGSTAAWNPAASASMRIWPVSSTGSNRSPWNVIT